MRDTRRYIIERCSGACLLILAGSLGCGSSTTSTDVAYEDDYAGDYYYPADVGYAGLYGAGVGYGIYLVTPVQSGLAAQLGVPAIDAAVDAAGGTKVDSGTHKVDSGTSKVDSGTPKVDSGTHKVDSGTSGTGSGSTTVRLAVGEAIRNLARGGSVCPGQVTVTRPSGPTACGLAGDGLNIVFNGCQLSAGGTVDGTVAVQFNLSASDAACTSSTTISIGYTSTVTNLVYTGTGGAKIGIPTQMDMATVHVPLGQAPATVTMMSSGEVQRFGTNGSMTSDRSYTGSRAFSSISFADQTYSVDGAINLTDKAGGTATMTGTGLKREKGCCKPTGGTLAVSRTGGSHSGSHSWTYSATCGSAMFDGKNVTLPACL